MPELKQMLSGSDAAREIVHGDAGCKGRGFQQRYAGHPRRQMLQNFTVVCAVEYTVHLLVTAPLFGMIDEQELMLGVARTVLDAAHQTRPVEVALLTEAVAYH